jgi:Tfp pilus assembly protein PilV
MLLDNRGVSLIELLLGVMLLIVSVTTLAIFFPRAAKSQNLSRQMWVANNLANSKLQEIRKKPFALLAPTPSAFIPGGSCDCRVANAFATPQAGWSQEVAVGNAHYTLQWCVNHLQEAGGTWTPSCPDPNVDVPYKNIRVRVTWNPVPGAENRKWVETEGMTTRL